MDDNPYRSPLTPGESLDARRDYRMTPFQRRANTIVGALVFALGLAIIVPGIVANLKSSPFSLFDALALIAFAVVTASPGLYIIYWARSHPTTADRDSDGEHDHVTS